MAGSRVALLRGINVGTAKRVAMADLRALVEALGYRDVRTLLNSGNVVFTVPAAIKGDPAAKIEKAITARLRLTSRVTVLSAAELALIVDDNPLGKVADDPRRLLVTVLTDPRERAAYAPLTRQRWTPEAVALGARVLYAWCPQGQIDSPLAKAIAKAVADRATTRNWATILKLHALVCV